MTKRKNLTKEEIRRYRVSRVARNKAYVQGVKDISVCRQCGEGRSVCLDFHHKEASTKLFELGDIRTQSLEKIAAEIGKCIVLCAVC